ncbi:penicillin-binding transpeptidase domain-containing protein [Arthrobacter sp. zg-Y820]|uniref:penicillin-binding transpeptidase domain-containing protein n=1 Tax=unclassified Arthrobacter TaxID=235627 RepID=UPI001E3ECD99|nr:MULTISPECIES: penicillin-binding transpeptidase domain-containing protein [unclassified Arthrobacter]MCC9197001.1 penicillin-binding protein [Arthrobacter sp. zg-Y820]MDK1279866.1 penicillin-binding transpeptidase domain-containing protein [Arthrobacter sp. zg.Y820]MDK1360012.1 penicillin-binding transpeptidase domain-containing protein [Arthrobacter sp. zg-Y1219]WIB09171.1 penicillin-binding transpeptidase domain-containing protein [Arthrobacter sp. zg-Y820]
MGKTRTLTSVFAASALAFTLVSCSGDKPSPQDAAASLAEGLAAGDVAKTSFLNNDPASVNTELEEILAGMGEVRPAVTVAGIQEHDDGAATASLDYAWDFDGDATADWTYDTSVPLSRSDDDSWQAQWEPSVLFRGLREGERLVAASQSAPRAAILGAGGEPLVTQREVFRVGIDKTAVDEAGLAASAAALATLLELDPAAYTATVEAAGAEAFVEAIALRTQDEPDLPARVAEIPGAVALPDSMDLAPTRTFARALLGSVGEATAELIEESDGALAPGDTTGLSGLQQQYDAQLRGTDGITVSVVDAAGEVVTPTVFTSGPKQGTPLQTTLDPKLQSLAESVLEDEPSASAIVAVRPSTGEVLTVANGPGSEGQQTALLGQYPPGSTFKMATSLALLRQGTTPDSVLSCPAELLVDGRKFNNASSYPAAFVGDIPLRDAFAQSCNTAFIGTRDTVPQEALAAAAADLGIGVEQTLGTAAFFGSVPETAEGTNHAAAMIGQGELLVSPLALAVAAASVGKGERVAPVLVTADPAAEASASATASASAAPPAATPDAAGPGALTAAEAASLRELMRGVVTDGGAKMLLDVPGEPVTAKTGTAEFGSEVPPRTHAWVVAVQGDLAVAVFVEEGELGSTSGGPLMQAFLNGAAG